MKICCRLGVSSAAVAPGRARDLDRSDSRGARVVEVGVLERSRPQRHHLGHRRRDARERRGHEMRARLDRHAEHHVVIGVEMVGMQFLTLDVIFGDRDQDARVRTPILAADREALDQLVVEAELNFVLVIDPVDGAAKKFRRKRNRRCIRRPAERRGSPRSPRGYRTEGPHSSVPFVFPTPTPGTPAPAAGWWGRQWPNG